MRTTLTLSVDNDLAEFINSQQGTVDPSAFINKLLHEDQQRRGIEIDPAIKAKMKDETSKEMELFLDENTHAAG